MRFNHVFAILLFLSALSAFFGGRVSEAVRPNVGVLFSPVSQPTRALAHWATGRLAGPAPRLDDRPRETVFTENQALRQENLILSNELVELRRINGERWNLGALRDRCTPLAVVGSDAGERESLLLRSGTLSGLRDGMYVLHDHDIVGTLVTGTASAHVRLVTDRQSKVEAGFGTFRNVGNRPATQPSAAGATSGFTRLDLPPRVLEGNGKGAMISRTIPHSEVVRVGLQRGDWAILEDPAWHPDLKGRRLGVVTDIRVSSRMMAEIEIKPDGDLLQLREVMVLTKER